MATSEKDHREGVSTTIDYFDDPGVPLVPMVIGGYVTVYPLPL